VLVLAWSTCSRRHCSCRARLLVPFSIAPLRCGLSVVLLSQDKSSSPATAADSGGGGGGAAAAAAAGAGEALDNDIDTGIDTGIGGMADGEPDALAVRGNPLAWV